MDFWLKNHQWKRGRCRSGCTVSSILRSLRVGHIHATCFGLWCVWNDCDRVIPNLPQRTPFLHVDRRLSIFHKSIYCTVTVGRGIRGTFPEFALSCFVQSSNANIGGVWGLPPALNVDFRLCSWDENVQGAVGRHQLSCWTKTISI